MIGVFEATSCTVVPNGVQWTYMSDVLIKLIADWLMFAICGLALYSFVFRVPRKDWWYWAWRVVLAGLTCYVAARLIGHFWQPAEMRPFELLGVEPGAAYLPNPGFPSDHALFAMFLTLAVWYATRDRLVVGIMLVLTLTVCVGRVLALVHSPLDVIGGVLIAFSGIMWYYYGRGRQKIVK